ncbi:hypothetical protein [Marinospirillum sp.]|uniref:hypothetical protein n=1 Tax=Marinospirillum sp. TaxID=2183934 RepID=UPI0028709A5A|nr:hypothetical protein [Marinospirillum sp.]MDR9467664.1 hypothetical protein [Marinospirillum sp.]
MNQQAVKTTPEYTSTDLLNTTAAPANDQSMLLQEVVPLEYRLRGDRINLDRVSHQVRAAKANLVRHFFSRLFA